MAVFTPIPSASMRTATKAKPGDLRSWRKANRRSVIIFVRRSFRPECDHWIDAGRATGGQPGRSHGGEGKNYTDAEEDSEISRLDLKENAAQPMRDRERTG